MNLWSVAIVGSYAVSLATFFIDFLRENRLANRLGVLTLCVVWLLETLYLGVRIEVDHALPLVTAGQATILYSWVLITVSLVVSYFSKIDYFTFFINLLGFLFVAFDMFVGDNRLPVAPRLGDLLLFHVGSAILSYLLFALSCIFSILYLLEDSALRLKRFASGPFRRLPPLEQLDRVAFRCVWAGVPFLFFALVLGAIWYYVMTGRVWFFDAKPVVSFLLFVIYGAYLFLRATGRTGGRKAAWLNVAAFFGIAVNFLVISEYVSGFHRW